MTEKSSGKVLPTIAGKQRTRKAYIIEYHTNNPQASASEIAEKIQTSPGYVWKTLSEARKPSKDIRGRSGRIFAHGKVFYENWVTQTDLSTLNAPVINPRTGMKQIGRLRRQDPCSCQIHANGHLIMWPRSNGWREWLADELTLSGWKKELAQLVVDRARLNVSVVECGVKPSDSGYLPKDLLIETEWGVILVRDDTPERGVLELKLSVPDMQHYLGLPEIKKKLELIEQGSLTHAQSQRAIEALLISLIQLLQSKAVVPHGKEEDRFHREPQAT